MEDRSVTGAHALQPGATVGGYRIESVVGTDATGALYRATQPALGRTVAVQVATAPAESDDGRRFVEVARRVAAIDHPNMLPVYEVGIDAGRPFAVLRDLQGERLDELLAAGPLTPERAVAVAGDVAGALDALVTAGVAPERLDPRAIVVTPDVAYLAPVIAGGGSRAPGDARAASSASALAGLLGSVVELPAGDGLSRVIEAGRAGGYTSAAALATAARDALAPAPRRRRRARAPAMLAAGLISAAAVLAAVILGGAEDERPSRAQTSPASAPAGRIAARIALNAEPGSVAVGHGLVWVATRQGTVLRVDPNRNEVTGAPIRFMPPRRGENVTVRTGAGAVFVLDGSGGRLTRIDPRSGRVSGRLRLGGSLDGATVADGSVWVTQTARSGVGSLVRVDARTLQIVKRLPGGWAGFAFDVEIAGGAAWVMSAGSGTVIRIDLASGARRELRPNGQPLGAAVRGDTIWIPDPIDATVTPLDVREPQLPEQVARPGYAFAVTATRDAIWVASNTEPRPDAPVRLHRVDPGVLRSVGRPVEVGRAAGWPTAGFGAIWQPDAAKRQLIKVVPTTPPPAPSAGPPSDRPRRVLQPGPLAPGEWHARHTQPPLTMRVDEPGWVSLGGAEGIELVRFDEPDTTFGVITARRAFDADGGVRPLRRSSDLVDAVRSNPGLRVLRRDRTTVGGRPAVRMEVAVRGDKRRLERCDRPCTPLLPLEQGTYVLETPSVLRISMLDVDGGVVAANEESSTAEGFSHTEAVKRTLRFDTAR